MHYQFECWMNWVAVPADSTEMQLFLKFVRGLDGLTAYRTEWTIFAEAERLAGSIDFVAQDANGLLVIFDWKRTKDFIYVVMCTWVTVSTLPTIPPSFPPSTCRVLCQIHSFRIYVFKCKLICFPARKAK